MEATSSGFNPTNTVIPLPGMQDPRTIAAALTSQLVTYLPTGTKWHAFKYICTPKWTKKLLIEH